MALPIVFLSSSTAINSGEKINVNQVIDYEKLDIVNPVDATKTEYSIVFTYAPAFGKTAKLRYLLKATRDTAFTNISTAISTAI